MVWSLQIAGGARDGLRREPFTVAGLSSFGEDADGELYLMSVESRRRLPPRRLATG